MNMPRHIRAKPSHVAALASSGAVIARSLHLMGGPRRHRGEAARARFSARMRMARTAALRIVKIGGQRAEG